MRSAVAPSRPRNYSAEQARRNEIARSLGFRSAYDRRIRGGATATPETPKPEGAELTRARGHRADYLTQILREIEPRSLIMVSTNLGNLERNERGNWDEIPVSAFTPDAEQIEFVLYDISEDELDWFIDELDYLDVDYSPNYNLGEL